MRVARRSIPGVLTHVIIRFYEGRWFLDDDEERAKYLHLLGYALLKTDWRCVAYALMSNHVHLGFIPGTMPLENWAKRVHSPFANWINERHQRLGPVIAGRPREWVMHPLNEAYLIAYIHNNPVRAGVVPRANESNWTSHRAYLGREPRPKWLDIAAGMAICGFGPRQRSGFDAFVDRTVGWTLDEPSLQEVRAAARKRGSIELATPVIGTELEVPLVTSAHGIVRPEVRELLVLVASVMRTDPGDICSRTRRAGAASARRVLTHACRRMGLTYAAVAAALGISHQAVSRLGDASLTAAETRALITVEEWAARACSGNWPRRA